MSEKRRFNVTIAGRPYTIVGERSNEHMEAVVELVNTQLSQLSELAPQLSIMDHSILMAVNAVSDQLVKEARIMELEAELEQLKAASTSSKLNANIPYRK
ncbi:MAG TPA: cell division protein ZapA [Globicatella sulfidifaciens]|uniref:Cell division protein ZapA n=2 Tax=Globicatella sulfidifaciens TaxID=136093 RepID=A0A1T4L703_9LACT|nr:cell division protein ZapA [Globicatella sulfidifaciens]NLJ18287.1 cell division protein ZapA [Globicatella sulfidifaciens]SJZ50423.1 Cell division protein ZapA, inhibits GTPase activity of FtsZ [Globicatella sulfidifaciens DSM 15739]HJF16485.1 cell division protein ZapA [Globicatella sulfidifaciens]